ncbi:MAG: helix-turn-helix domain-containing protein [Planctomycetaceae bacterium]|nr:helix-turn-helix domain-containing protein [Planctomycetaceae bacterium]
MNPAMNREDWHPALDRLTVEYESILTREYGLPPICSQKEALRALGISLTAMYRLRLRGDIKFIQSTIGGRITYRRRELAAYLARLELSNAM